MKIKSNSLLIIWTYHPAVGHSVELLQIAANLKSVNPNLKIYAIINNKAIEKIFKHTTDLIEGILTVDIDNFKSLESEEVFNNFDYVIYPKQFKNKTYLGEALNDCFDYISTNFRGKIFNGYIDDENFKSFLKYKPYSPFKINVEVSEEIKRNFKGHPKIAVMLKGASGQTIYPNLKTWKYILNKIKENYPKAKFYFTGLSKVHLTKQKDLSDAKKELTEFINSIPDSINGFDVDLEKQLAIMKESDLFLSPHTGFAFLSPCLGTPWLALSGGIWEEEMPAKMPFYSVLPNCKHYPCHSGDMKLECKVRLKIKQPIACMSNLTTKTADILKGMEKLLDENYSFDQAFKDYEKSATDNNVNIKKLWRLDQYKKNCKSSDS